VKIFFQVIASALLKMTAVKTDVITMLMELFAGLEIIPENVYSASGIMKMNAVGPQMEVSLDKLRLVIIENVRI